MNRALAEFLVADGRPEGSQNFPQVNGFLFAVACSPEKIDEDLWMPMIFNHQSANYENDQQQKEIEQGLREELYLLEAKLENQENILAPWFQATDVIQENFDEDAAIAHWGRGFLQGHDWLSALWDAYFPKQQLLELNACMDVLSFFADKKTAEKICEAQKIEGLGIEVFAESAIANFESAAQTYAYYGLSIRAALDNQ